MRRWRLLVFAGVFVGAVLALLPLAFVLRFVDIDAAGVSASRVDGSVWRGRLVDAQWRGHALGDVRMRLAPLPLLLGRVELVVASPQFRGRVHTGDSPRLRVDAARVAVEQVIGNADAEWMFREVDLRFDSQRCLGAGGQARIDVALAGMQPQAITGDFACEGDAAVAHLAPEGGAIPVQGALRLHADGRFEVQWLASPTDPLMQAALQAQGFEPGPAGFGHSVGGRWLP